MNRKMKIDRTIPVPAYFQLKQIIKDRIQNKTYIPNHTILTEDDLIEEFKISRTTVRQVLSELANEGLVERRKGIGTIINEKEKKDVFTYLNAINFSFDIKSFVSTRIISLDIQKPSPLVAKKLEIDVNEKIYALTRVRSDRKSPFSISTSYLPEKLFPNFIADSKEAANGLYRYIDQTSYKITEIEQFLETGHCEKENSILLECNPHSSIWIITNTAFSNEIPVEYSVTACKQEPGMKIRLLAKRNELN